MAAAAIYVSHPDGRLLKLAADGSEVWSRQAIPAGDDDAKTRVFVQDDSSVFLVAHSGGTLPANGTVYKYDADGNLMWSKEPTIPFGASLSQQMGFADSDGEALYLLQLDGVDDKIVKWDSGGNNVWTATPTGGAGAIGVAPSGEVYYAHQAATGGGTSTVGHITNVGAQGWVSSTDTATDAAYYLQYEPVNDHVFFSCGGFGNVEVFDGSSGATVWIPNRGRQATSAGVSTDSTVFAACESGSVYRFNVSTQTRGEIVGSSPVTSNSVDAAAVDDENNVYIVDSDGHVTAYAQDSDGYDDSDYSVKWTTLASPTQSFSLSAIAIFVGTPSGPPPFWTKYVNAYERI